VSQFIFYPSVTVDPNAPTEVLKTVRTMGLARVCGVLAEQQRDERRAGQKRPRIALDHSWFIVARTDLDSEARHLHGRLTTAANTMLKRYGLDSEQGKSLVRWHWNQMCGLRAQTQLRGALSTASGREAQEAAAELQQAVERTTASIVALETRAASPIQATVPDNDIEVAPRDHAGALQEARLALYHANQLAQADPDAGYLML
jgi:hypothetical protein